MKTSPLLALAIATTAFAGSSIYLGQQLREERATAAKVEQETRRLNARIAELEAARAPPEKIHGFVSGSFQSGETLVLPAPPLGTTAPAPRPAEKGASRSTAPQGGLFAMQQRMETSPALQKMMRSQTRAMNRRLYADVGDELGLSKESVNKLIDLLSEQQTLAFDGSAPEDPNAAARYWEDRQRAHQAALSELLGPEKVLELQAYQMTLPARNEYEMLARQLEGNDMPLTQEQGKKLRKIYVEEHKRVPMPEPTRSMVGDEYSKLYAAWQDDYERRVIAEAAGILSVDQLNAHKDMQQMQREMREQFQTSAAAARLRMNRTGAATADSQTFNALVPAQSAAGATVMFSTESGTEAEAVPEPKP